MHVNIVHLFIIYRRAYDNKYDGNLTPRRDKLPCCQHAAMPERHPSCAVQESTWKYNGASHAEYPEERSRRRSQSPVATISQRPRPLGESTRPDNVQVVSKYVLPTISMYHTFSDLKFSLSDVQLSQVGIDLFT